ncbi:uncharacterized protein LOC114240609 isoform X1 [Bombyx mandarina]|uniref:Uncharacterized protein LOC114240609 isoform X1 n=1 Tax=Bombyx mandarina TaxID=7092 RepID=A0A6J2JC61_BOMMA|nr:uncharacterized protein LOC114240609 isoform X1 [Bombyx mandarina]
MSCFQGRTNLFITHLGKLQLYLKNMSKITSVQLGNFALIQPLSRRVHIQTINKNMQYISNDDRNIKVDSKTMKANNLTNRPLCIILSWMLAKPKHVLQYANIYLQQDFDVLSVSCSPMQFMLPVKGAKLIAADLMNFLENNQAYGPLVIHGFSVGTYVWAELLVKSLENIKRYKPVLDHVTSQIWDSTTYVYELHLGLPYAVFPNNKILRKAFTAYCVFHLKLFHNTGTKHYLRATDVYRNTPCRAPGLFLCSMTDPIAAAKRIKQTHDTWKSLGIEVNWKCWDESPHVKHLIYNREEYLAAIYSHLQQSGIMTSVR